MPLAVGSTLNIKQTSSQAKQVHHILPKAHTSKLERKLISIPKTSCSTYPIKKFPSKNSQNLHSFNAFTQCFISRETCFLLGSLLRHETLLSKCYRKEGKNIRNSSVSASCPSSSLLLAYNTKKSSIHVR